MQAIRSLILTLCVISLALAEQSPVFLWGANSEAKPSLTTVRSEEFVKLVTPLLADKALIVFLEKDLTNKDFLCTNAADGKSCFARLQGVSGKTYYSSVENAVETLRTIAVDAEYNFVDASGKFSKPLETGAGKINLVKFNDDTSAVRGFNLESHDSIIAAVTSELGDNVFFMYTSEPSTPLLKRQRRDTTNGSQGKVFRSGADLLLYFTSLTITDHAATPVVTVLDINNMIVNVDNNTALSVTLTSASGAPLTFDVTLAGGYFFMKNVKYNDIKFLSSTVNAPTDFSYYCGNLTLPNNPENASPYTLKWNSLQFQAPFGSTKNESFVFGDAWHCVGFFTEGILSGLLIVALLLTITFIGVCWMMDINTMDRFDDPKGKTITINASD